MKKIIALLLAVTLLFSLFGCSLKNQVQEGSKTARTCLNFEENLRGVWLSYYEIGELFAGADEAAAKEKLETIMARLKENDINTLFFHARAFADAFYDSSLFPKSDYCPQGVDLLALAAEAAHRHGISLHAWVNPYRVALGKGLEALGAENPAVKLYKKNAQNLLLIGKDVYFNPASSEAQRLILDGIRELVVQYAIDGVHFDDYFYPSAEKSIDKFGFSAYRKSGGQLTQEDYRREQVTALITAAKIIIKNENETMLFGISPQADIGRNKNELFADVGAWAKAGLVDYLMPQIYFGFENEASPFEETVLRWKELLAEKKVKLYCGLALYKVGKTDEYASKDTENADSAYYEWVRNENIIARQITFLKQQGIPGYALFSYGNLE